MKCLYCGKPDTKVIDSRTMDDGAAIRRRRLCENCGARVTTYERIDMIALAVIKNNGTREIFDRAKIINGMIKSCNKRPVSMQQIESIADDIELAVLSSVPKEISTKTIGEMIMDKLKIYDEVSYVRFASVYRQFKDIDSFMEELSKLLNEKKE